MTNELDLRNMTAWDMQFHGDHLENEMKCSLHFSADEEMNYKVIHATESSEPCDITCRIRKTDDENTIEEVVAKECFITGYSSQENMFNDGMYYMELDFVTSNAGIRILSVLKSRDGKEIITTKEIAKKVRENCKSRNISFNKLEEVVLSCMI